MNLHNFRLRLRLAEIDALLVQIEDDIHRPSKSSSIQDRTRRLHQERRRRLTNEKTAIQESIDRIVYPILTIPVEITSEIFHHCLPDEPQRPSQMTAPMLLGAVCREWRIISRGDSRLWAALKISIWRSDGFKRLVRDWLLRAGSMPLSLSFVLPRYLNRCSCPIFPDETATWFCFGSFQLSSTQWGHLTTLRGDFFTPHECLSVLYHARRLVRCEFRDIIDTEDFLPSPPVKHLLLSQLECLTLVANPDYEYETGCVHILQALDAPRLRALDLRCFFPLADVPFLSFLKRAPGIQTFTARFDGPEEEIEDGVADAVFRAMPSLTTLGLHLDSDEFFFQLFSLLANSSTFLPHVQVITFSVLLEIGWADTFTDALVTALTARWDPPVGVARLLDFEFNFSLDHDNYQCDDEPDTVAERWWGLVEKGMKVHVGPPEAPWVKVSQLLIIEARSTTCYTIKGPGLLIVANPSASVVFQPTIMAQIVFGIDSS
ncbi:hypothetical protein FB451DRAFT_1370163 [Mycena latifolia]|nr:hypothetical protein FB451DRAFT_1370163 [Mycena latifolia]